MVNVKSTGIPLSKTLWVRWGMVDNKVVGLKGEVGAKKFLEDKGYKILECNYKNKIGEIDLIAKDNNCLVFVEVKARESLRFGYPREAVNFYKQQKIRRVAMGYLKHKGLYDKINVRFDVIDILGDKITHIENAF